MHDLSFLIGDQTYDPCSGKSWSLNHWTIGGSPCIFYMNKIIFAKMTGQVFENWGCGFRVVWSIRQAHHGVAQC